MPASRQKQQVKEDFGLGVLESAERADWGDTSEGELDWVVCVGESNWVWMWHEEFRVGFEEKMLPVSEKERILALLSKMLEGSSDRTVEAYVGLDSRDAWSSDTM